MSNTQTVRCQHCHQSFVTNSYKQHARVCPLNPASFDAIRAALESPDMPGYAVSLADYRVRSRELGVASADVLKTTFHGWKAALAHFGLMPVDNQELADRQAMREVIAAATSDAHVLAEDAARAYLLPVLRVLPAPGLYVNGKPCVRCVLR